MNKVLVMVFTMAVALTVRAQNDSLFVDEKPVMALGDSLDTNMVFGTGSGLINLQPGTVVWGKYLMAINLVDSSSGAVKQVLRVNEDSSIVVIGDSLPALTELIRVVLEQSDRSEKVHRLINAYDKVLDEIVRTPYNSAQLKKALHELREANKSYYGYNTYQ